MYKVIGIGIFLLLVVIFEILSKRLGNGKLRRELANQAVKAAEDHKQVLADIKCIGSSIQNLRG